MRIKSRKCQICQRWHNHVVTGVGAGISSIAKCPYCGTINRRSGHTSVNVNRNGIEVVSGLYPTTPNPIDLRVLEMARVLDGQKH